MTVEESENRLKSAGRNDPCPCGSGKKYKKCHQAADETAVQAEHARQRAGAEAAAAAEAQEEARGSDSRDARPDHKGKRPHSPQNQQQVTSKSRNQPPRAANLPRRGAV